MKRALLAVAVMGVALLAAMMLPRRGTAQMSHSQAQYIAEPSQMPDEVIFGKWLEHWTGANGKYSLYGLHLAPTDEAKLIAIGQAFRPEHDRLVAWDAEDPDNRQDAFYEQHNALIGRMWARAQNELTGISVLNLTAHINHLKEHTRLSTTDRALGVAVAKQAERELYMVASAIPMAAGPPQSSMGGTANYSTTDYISATGGPYWEDFSDPQNWVNVNTGHNWTFSTGSATPGSGWSLAYYTGNGATQTLNGCTAITVATPPTSGNWFGFATQVQNGGNTLYFLVENHETQGNPMIIFDAIVNGVWYNDYSWSVPALGPGDELQLCRHDNGLFDVMFNGTQLNSSSFQDTRITTPGYSGVAGWVNGSLSGITVSVPVSVNITTAVSGSATCPPVPSACVGVTHTPNIVFQDAYYGTTTGRGQSVPPAQYLSYEFGNTYPQDFLDCFGDEPCAPVTINIDSEVICSVAGVFWSVTTPGMMSESAISFGKNTYQPFMQYGWTVSMYCSPQSSPADAEFSGLAKNPPKPPPIKPYDYYEGKFFCERPNSAPPGTPWKCENSLAWRGYFFASLILNRNCSFGQPCNCTNYDNKIVAVWP